MTNGYTDADGFYHYGEADTDPTFSQLLNRSADAVALAVPPLIVDILAADATPVNAAAAAVDAKLADAGVVTGALDGSPLVDGPNPAAGGFVGDNGRVTDLTFDESGRVLTSTIDDWATRMIAAGAVPGTLTSITEGAAVGGFVGDNGRLTDLVVDADGRVPDSTLEDWAPRLQPYLDPPAPVPVDPSPARKLTARTSSGAVVPVVSDPSTIACWGDSLTEGWPYAAVDPATESWPAVLATLLAAGTTFNGGQAGESADEISLRQGGLVIRLSGTIPASGPVDLDVAEVIAWRLDRAWDCVGTLGGIPGALHRDGAALTVTFTRTADGNAVTLADPTPFYSAPGDLHAGNVQVYFGGRNDIGYTSPAGDIAERVITATVAAVGRLTATRPRVLVLGTTTATTEKTGNANHTAVLKINDTLAGLYPDAYFDIRGYLVTQCIYDLGITPTATDLANMAGDTLPPSIMVADDAVHYSAATSAQVAAQIHAQLALKGWIN
jgi:hypothetical protein